MNTILIGFKNVGKTTIGKNLATKTNRLFIDTDHLIEEYYHKKENSLLTAKDIYQQKGSKYFRDLEKKIITTLKPPLNSIIATGGGSITDSENVECLKQQGLLIYLYATFETLLSRFESQLPPAFVNIKQWKTDLHTLYQERIKQYKMAADIEISTEQKSISDICDHIKTAELRNDLIT